MTAGMYEESSASSYLLPVKSSQIMCFLANHIYQKRSKKEKQIGCKWIHAGDSRREKEV